MGESLSLCVTDITESVPSQFKDSAGKQVVRHGFKTTDQRRRCVTNEVNYSVGRR